MARNYDAGLRVLDFIGDAEGSRETINHWVEEQTEDKIEELLPPGSITDLTRLVLVNAVYFNADWYSPFEETTTQNGDFNTLDGQIVQCAVMQQTMYFYYMKGDGFAAIELLYSRGFSMVLIVPDDGGFETFDVNLSMERINEIANGLRYHMVALSMPKWTFKPQGVSLTTILQSLGMRDAFIYGTADFSGMDGTRNLFISDVIHKAYIAVDEKGTEAAAATASEIGGSSGEEPPIPIPFDIDRPFIYLIRDRQSNTILFMGRMLDPTKTQ